MFEKDFILDEVEEFNIGERKFKYKLMTTKDQAEWGKETFYTDKNGKRQEDPLKVMTFKFQNLIEVPWKKEVIEEAIGKQKTWQELDKDERYELLSKLSPALRDEIMKKLNELDRNRQEIKKN